MDELGIGSVYDWAAFCVLATVALTAATLLPPRGWPRWFRQLIVAGVAVRIAGSWARLYSITDVYGRGDALRYYATGLQYAEWIIHGEFGRVAEAAGVGSGLFGTELVEVIAGVVLTVTGPSIRALFLVFTLIGFAGALLMCLACRQNRDPSASRLLTGLLLLWPSLCFWPTSVGKEAPILLGFGCLIYGFGQSDLHGPRWLILCLGVALIALVRPHVALLVVSALLIAAWSERGHLLTPRRLLQGLVICGLVSAVALQSLRLLGVRDSNFQDTAAIVEYRANNLQQGGSRITRTGGAAAVPMAVVNVLCRPLPWEARNPMMAISALEVLVLWGFILSRRHQVVAGLREWRAHRVLRLTVPLFALLVIFYGGFIPNIGILARQRVVILPLLFVLMTTVQSRAPRHGRR